VSNLKIEREFSVTPETVFAFVTQTDNLLKWWGPENTSIAEHNLDLSKLGPWWFILVDPMGGRHKVSGEVLVVDPPNSVEFTLIVHNPDGDPSIDSVVRFEITASASGGAHFLLTQSGLTSEEIVTGSKKGWVSTLLRLEQILSEI